jgi:hypothetical protein
MKPPGDARAVVRVSTFAQTEQLPRRLEANRALLFGSGIGMQKIIQMTFHIKFVVTLRAAVLAYEIARSGAGDFLGVNTLIF